MATKTITMHQLLAELKMYDKRIKELLESGITEDNLMVNAVKECDVTDPKNKTEIEVIKSKLQSNYDTISHLLANKAELERARINSNNVTMIRVGTKDMTVAEAIKRKHEIEYDRAFLRLMTKQYEATVKNKNEINNRVEKDKDEYALRHCPSVEGQELTERLQKIEELKENYRQKNLMTLLDPNGLEKRIAILSREIEEFDVNVDAALSVSNALTIVEVTLKD